MVKTLTSAERVRAAFGHRKTDRIAVYHCSFSSWAGRVLLGRDAHVGGGVNQWMEATALWEGPEAHAEYVRRWPAGRLRSG